MGMEEELKLHQINHCRRLDDEERRGFFERFTAMHGEQFQFKVIDWIFSSSFILRRDSLKTTLKLFGEEEKEKNWKVHIWFWWKFLSERRRDSIHEELKTLDLIWDVEVELFLWFFLLLSLKILWRRFLFMSFWNSYQLKHSSRSCLLEKYLLIKVFISLNLGCFLLISFCRVSEFGFLYLIKLEISTLSRRCNLNRGSFKMDSGKFLLFSILLLVSLCQSSTLSCSSESPYWSIRCSRIHSSRHLQMNFNECLGSVNEIMTVTSACDVLTVLQANETLMNEPELTQIEALAVYSSQIVAIPNGIAGKLPHLRGLRIINCNLIELHKSNLEQFGSALVSISFENNLLVSLDSDIFEHQPRLFSLSLSHNPIKYINPNLFENLKKLSIQWVDLRNIQCLDNKVDVYFTGNSISFRAFKWPT